MSAPDGYTVGRIALAVAAVVAMFAFAVGSTQLVWERDARRRAKRDALARTSQGE